MMAMLRMFWFMFGRTGLKWENGHGAFRPGAWQAEPWRQGGALIGNG
jgi:hypothetical protein